jgi:DUF1680 family protein
MQPSCDVPPFYPDAPTASVYNPVMRSLLTVLLAGCAALAVPMARQARTSSDYPIQAVPLAHVRITGGFWAPRLDTNRTVTIQHILSENELTGRVANFLKAAGKATGEYQGQRYNDTDVYKVIEAASYSLIQHPDPALSAELDRLIAIIAAAQAPDGYLYNPRQVDPKNPAPGAGPERWSYLHTSHELYDMGHMIEAAVAHFQATGKTTFLDVATKAADLICRVFGPGARHDAPGHEEIELALVKLYRVTGNPKYLEQARFFLDQRGRPHAVPPVLFERGSRFFMYNDRAYRQDDLPILEQPRAVGHAVRATYMFIGMTDVAALLGADGYARKADAFWDDVTAKRVYITGGLGSEGRTEAFGDDYVLPNRAYAETCASVGGLLWYHRMFRRWGDAKYLDMFERTLYNGYLSGVSLAGDTFFYQNPLESDGSRERQPYFDVACCPANLARFMAQLPGLIYAKRDDVVYVNLFIGSQASLEAGGTALTLRQQTRYPWDGHVLIEVEPDRPVDLELRVRVPGWSRGAAMPSDLYRFATLSDAAPPGVRAGSSRFDRSAMPHDVGISRPDSPVTAQPSPTLRVNGRPVGLVLDKGFATIRRRWQPGDTIELDLPMPVRRVIAREEVAADRGRAAIERGPMVYALEGTDNGGGVSDLRVPLDGALRTAFRADLLGGVTVVTGTAIVTGTAGRPVERPFMAVPYYAWGNRGVGEMEVWIPR